VESTGRFEDVLEDVLSDVKIEAVVGEREGFEILAANAAAIAAGRNIREPLTRNIVRGFFLQPYTSVLS